MSFIPRHFIHSWDVLFVENNRVENPFYFRKIKLPTLLLYQTFYKHDAAEYNRLSIRYSSTTIYVDVEALVCRLKLCQIGRSGL